MVAARVHHLLRTKKKQQVDRRAGCSGLVDCGLLGRGTRHPRRASFLWGWEAAKIGKCRVGPLQSSVLDLALSWVQVHLKAMAVTCQALYRGAGTSTSGDGVGSALASWLNSAVVMGLHSKGHSQKQPSTAYRQLQHTQGMVGRTTKYTGAYCNPSPQPHFKGPVSSRAGALSWQK